MDAKGNKAIISHDGIVRESGNNSVIVKISSASACSGCHAEGHCNISGNEEKLIKVSGHYNVKTGDQVTLIMQQSMGFSAVFLGYLLPLVILVSALIICVSFSVPEMIAGLLSLAILVPYYFILYFFRNRIDNKFNFTIKT